jgi:flagellar basal-body rod modification protein FlgD
MSTLASVAAAQSAASTTSTGSTSAVAAGTSTASANSLAGLSSNFSDFLNLLMTQLKNQDPSSPMDTNSFTQELVQFSEVEQQINTNSSLGTLIQLTQSGQMLQGSAVIGKTVEVSSTSVPLQDGQATIDFNAPVAGTATATIFNSAGAVIGTQQIAATQGDNKWTWDGQQSNGETAADGTYTISLTGQSATGGTQTLPFNVVGVASGISNSGGTVDLQIGSLTTPFSNVQQVAN